MINLKEVALHPATYAQELLDRAEAAEADLATARADIGRYQDERVTLLGRIEALAVENEQLQSEINYLRSTDHAADLAFERAQKIGARYVIDETPLGQSLDGQGDEVEL